MNTITETFKQPFLDRVAKALEGAFSITWEGCHKIYICMDEESHNQQVEYGYDMVLVKDQQEALSKLYEWWDTSCGLRFINAIEGSDTFLTVIAQFEDDEVSD